MAWTTPHRPTDDELRQTAAVLATQATADVLDIIGNGETNGHIMLSMEQLKGVIETVTRHALIYTVNFMMEKSQ